MRRVVREFWLNSIAASPIWPQSIRRFIYRGAGLEIGRAGILSNQMIVAGTNVRIGDGVFVNVNCLFDAEGLIDIGAGAAIGPRVQFLTSTHAVSGRSSHRAGPVILQGVVIGRGCWIGAGTIILPGVSIGAGTIVAAGSVVTADLEADSFYAGTPARLKRRLHTQTGA